MTVVAKEDVFKFYDDFYRFLSSCGVDAVKTEWVCNLLPNFAANSIV